MVLRADFAAMSASSLDHPGDLFHLIGGDEIGVRTYESLPAGRDLLFRPEIVRFVPPLILCGRVTVEAIESNEIAESVAVVDELLQTGFGCLGPFTCLGLATLFDETPVHSEPAAVVVRFLAEQLLGV